MCAAKEDEENTDGRSHRLQLTAAAERGTKKKKDPVRHVRSRGGINPWNEADDRFQFRATSKGVNAAALTGMLGVRNAGGGV